MEKKKIHWYLIDIISKFKEAPLITLSYIIAWVTEFIGVILAIAFSVYFVKSGEIEKIFYDFAGEFKFSPFESYTNKILFNSFLILFLISFLLLCIAYIKANVGVKKVLMCISIIVLIIGIIVVMGIVLVVYLSINVSIGKFISICMIIMASASIIPIILVLMDKEMALYMKKWLASAIDILIIIPIILGLNEAGMIGLINGVIVIVVILVIRIVYRLRLMCPVCKKGHSLKRIDTFVLSERNISIRKELENRDYNTGKVISKQEQYVPGTETSYRITYVCKYCGEQCIKRKTEKSVNE